MGMSKDKEGWEKGKKNLKRGLLLGGAVSGGFIGYDLRKAYQNSRSPTVYKDGVKGLLKDAASKEDARLLYDILPLVGAAAPVIRTSVSHLLDHLHNKIVKNTGLSKQEKEQYKREYLKSIFLKAPLSYGMSKLMVRGMVNSNGNISASEKAKNIGMGIGAGIGGGVQFWKNRKKSKQEKAISTLLGAGVGGYVGRISTPAYVLMGKGLKTF